MDVLWERISLLIGFSHLIGSLHAHDVFADDRVSRVLLGSAKCEQPGSCLLIELIPAVFFLEEIGPLLMLINLVDSNLAHFVRVVPSLNLPVPHGQSVSDLEIEGYWDSLVILYGQFRALNSVLTAWMRRQSLRLLI